MNLSIKSLLAATVVAGIGATANADLIAYWNFNDSSTTGSPSVVDLVVDGGVFDSSSATPATLTHTLSGTNGSGTTNTYGSFTGSASNAVGTDVAGRDFGIVGSAQNGKTVTFTVPTIGYEDVIISWAVRITSSGHDDTAFEWSTDGSTWNTIIDPISVSSFSTYEVKSYDLSSATGIDNKAAVQFRLTFDSASSTNGSFRLDNVQFNATAAVVDPGPTAPEPATVGLLALGGLVMIKRRRQA